VALPPEPVQPLEVAFHHLRPADIGELERFFNTRLRFGCEENRLVFSRQDLDRPVHSADPAWLASHEFLAANLIREMDAGSGMAPKVAALVEKNVLHGTQPKIGEVAGELAVSVRKLQLSLQEEGVSFRQILNETRKRMAQQFLQQPDTSVCDTAFLLGFSDQSAFTHAFRRWTGQTPRQYRMKGNGM
jgi:AraC-like DNA-binding protein